VRLLIYSYSNSQYSFFAPHATLKIPRPESGGLSIRTLRLAFFANSLRICVLLFRNILWTFGRSIKRSKVIYRRTLTSTSVEHIPTFPIRVPFRLAPSKLVYSGLLWLNPFFIEAGKLLPILESQEVPRRRPWERSHLTWWESSHSSYAADWRISFDLEVLSGTGRVKRRPLLCSSALRKESCASYLLLASLSLLDPSVGTKRRNLFHLSLFRNGSDGCPWRRGGGACFRRSSCGTSQKIG